MARSFAGTDLLAGPSIAQPSAGASFLAWIKAPTGTTPRLFTIGAGSGTFKPDLTSTTTLRFLRAFSVSNGIWTVATGVHGMTLANWNHVAWTQDGTTAAALFYANGVSKAVTVGTAPSGTLTLTAGTVYVGNASGAGSPFGGSIAFVAVLPRVLTLGEIQQHMQTGFINGATLLYPIHGDTTEPDLSGNRNNISTITGTTVTAGPPTLPRMFPVAWRQREEYAAASAGSSPAAIDAATGVATTSLTGASQAAAVSGTAAGVATTSLVGTSTAAAALGIATGIATTGLTGSANAPAVADSASGAATASLVGGSTAAAVLGSAAGGATAALTGASQAAGAIGPAAGVATTALVGGSQAAGAADSAAGVAVTSLLGTSTAAAALGTAAGTSTASLVGSSATDGQSAITPAVGVAATGLIGASQAAAALGSAAGAATTSLVGSASFAAALGTASGSATTSLTGVSQAAGALSAATGAAVASLTSASQAAAALDPAAGLATTGALVSGVPTTIIGHMRAIFTARRPGMAITSSRPSISATAHAPGVSFSIGV